MVIDSYHVWWDPRIGADIARAAGRIAGYQLCDCVVPLPADALLGRGHLGDGSIDFRALTGPVLDAGYAGYAEVEIMSEKSGMRLRIRRRPRLRNDSRPYSADACDAARNWRPN